MIVELTGSLISIQTGTAVVQVGGIGYGVEVSDATRSLMPEPGSEVHLYTHLIVREDSWRLIGFHDQEERQVFLQLTEVNGVGIKAALSILSHLGVSGLREAVETAEWQRIRGAPGVGPKIAQRVQLELAGKWSPPVPRVISSRGVIGSSGDDVWDTLVSLGYSSAEAEAALKTLEENQSPEERLREALRQLDRKGGR